MSSCKLLVLWSATGVALHLLGVCRSRGRRALQGRTPPSTARDEVFLTFCASFPWGCQWKRTEGHTMSRKKKMCSCGNVRPGKQLRCWSLNQSRKGLFHNHLHPFWEICRQEVDFSYEVTFTSVTGEFSLRCFCCGQLWVCYNLLETPQSRVLQSLFTSDHYISNSINLLFDWTIDLKTGFVARTLF